MSTITSIGSLILGKGQIRIVTVTILSLVYFQSVYACSDWINTINGEYLLHKSEGNPPNNLIVKLSPSLDEFNFQISSFWAPKGSLKPSSPSIGFFKGLAKIKGCTAIYQVTDEANDMCSLVFVFGRTKSIEITSFGACGYGHNADPDGQYEPRN